MNVSFIFPSSSWLFFLQSPLPLSDNIQAGWGCEQPGLVGGVPACSRGLELDDLRSPFQPEPFYDSMISRSLFLLLSTFSSLTLPPSTHHSLSFSPPSFDLNLSLVGFPSHGTHRAACQPSPFPCSEPIVCQRSSTFTQAFLVRASGHLGRISWSDLSPGTGDT